MNTVKGTEWGGGVGGGFRQKHRKWHGGGAGDGFVSFLSLLECRRDTRDRRQTFLFLLHRSYFYFRERQKRQTGSELRKKIDCADFIYWINWKSVQIFFAV